MRRAAIFLALLVPFAAQAATPAPSDFSDGFRLQPQAGYALQELTLPDAVYVGATRTDLGDLRVFNGGGLVVPYALCAPPEPVRQLRERVLPVFALHRGQTAMVSDSRIDIRTAQGTQVRVAPATPAKARVASPEVVAYVLDTGTTPNDIDTLRIGWRAADGSSEARLRIESSADLDRWSPLIAATTLVHAQGANAQLDRAQITLPANRERYLRIETAGDGAPPELGEVVGELHVVAAPSGEVEFAAIPVTDSGTAAVNDGFRYDSQRLAPAREAKVLLPMNNMALVVALDRRSSKQQPWQTLWSGEVSSVDGSTASPIRFEPQAARDWRLRVLRGADSLGGGRPELHLRYQPQRLRFATQGEGPFLLVYGSARVTTDASLRCDQLAGATTTTTVEGGAPLLGQATAERAPSASLGGSAALKPLPPPTPLRQIVLWAILIAGALLLVWIALRLLRQLRADGGASS